MCATVGRKSGAVYSSAASGRKLKADASGL